MTTQKNTAATTARLTTLAEMLPRVETIADIGCDHGLLCAHLLETGKCKRAIAVDVSAGSLKKAEILAQELRLQDKLFTRQGDGLLPLTPGEAGAAVIAGMGGRLIASILHAAPEIAQNIPLILQPMQQTGDLRRFLRENGYRITDERMVKENGRIFELIAVEAGEERGETGIPEALRDEIGPILWQRGEPLLCESLERSAKGLLRVAEEASTPPEVAKTLRERAEAYNQAAAIARRKGEGMGLSKQQFLDAMEQLAPAHLAEGWDNVGMLIDCGQEYFKKILFALDLTEDVANQAIDLGADLVLTHHPVMLSGIKRLDGKTGESRTILQMIRHGISHFAAHTNYDWAAGGTNDQLAEKLGLVQVRHLAEGGIGRVGALPQETTLAELANVVAAELNAPNVRAAGDPGKIVRTVAIVTGSGMCAAKDAKAAGADVLLTGDAKHHNTAEAVELGLSVIDAGHFATERPAMAGLIRGLQAHLNAIQYESGKMTELCLADEAEVFWPAGNPVE